jgi:hypothetical protein
MGIKRSIGVAVATGLCWILPSVLVSAQPQMTERLVRSLGVDNDAFFVHSGISQSHFRFVVAMIARSARVPIGFEEVAQEPQKDDGNLAKFSNEDKTRLIGLTVGMALNALVAVDPRYAWREQDGVLIIRPVEAWRDATNFLNESVGPIDERRRRAIDIVKGLYDQKGLRVIWSSGGVIGNPTQIKSDLHLLISVTLPTSSTLDVLNAITKSHGQPTTSANCGLLADTVVCCRPCTECPPFSRFSRSLGRSSIRSASDGSRLTCTSPEPAVFPSRANGSSATRRVTSWTVPRSMELERVTESTA